MKRNKEKIIDGNHIYSVDYLMNTELTENDISNIFDTHSLLYSCLIGMFREAKSIKSDISIIKITKSNPRWVYENFWTKEQHDSYLEKLIKVYKNVYQYSYNKAKQEAQWFLFFYGLTIKGNTIDFEK